MADFSAGTSTVLQFTGEGLGKGEAELGYRLAASYLRLLLESDVLPAAICFYAGGVKMVLDDSPVLAELKAIEAKGVHVVVCSTCLNYYGVAERVAVGVIGGMTDIIEAQRRAGKVITL